MRAAAGLVVLLLLSACVPQKGRKRTAKAVKPPAAASAAAQKRAYDQGVEHFGAERWLEAKKAWQETVRLGPSTPLGRKAGENLQKVNAILAGLRDLERQ